MLNIVSKIIDNNHSVFLRGSRIYGTFNNNSDYDFYGVGNIDFNQKQLLINIPNTEWEFYTEEEFKQKLFLHDIAFLECLWLPIDKQFFHKNFSFELNKSVLRHSISSKASNSFVKAKKKLIVLEDRNVAIAQKSLFHSFRILDFGCQIAKHGKIIDYSSSNFILKEIQELEPEWNVWENKFKQLHNNLQTEFRQLAPK